MAYSHLGDCVMIVVILSLTHTLVNTSPSLPPLSLGDCVMCGLGLGFTGDGAMHATLVSRLSVCGRFSRIVLSEIAEQSCARTCPRYLSLRMHIQTNMLSLCVSGKCLSISTHTHTVSLSGIFFYRWTDARRRWSKEAQMICTLACICIYTLWH
jgi:hypothetical protein